MVAEKKGSIHILSLETRLPMITITCPECPLVQADWSVSNSLMVGAVGGNSWYVWDISESSLPLESGPAHNTVATGFRWCKLPVVNVCAHTNHLATGQVNGKRTSGPPQGTLS